MPEYSISDAKYEEKRCCTPCRWAILGLMLILVVLALLGAALAQWNGGWGQRGPGQGQGGQLGGLLDGLGLGRNNQQNFRQQPQGLQGNGGVLDGLLGSLGVGNNNEQFGNQNNQWQQHHGPPNWTNPPGQPFGNPGRGGGGRGLGGGEGIMGDLNRLLNQGNPGHQRWEEHARRFCETYPQHPKCAGGRRPEFSDLQGLLSNIGQNVRHLIPNIPKLNLKNPLNGVPVDLAQLIDQSIVQIGQLSVQAVQNIQGVCQRMNCLEQKASYVASKSLIREKVLNFEKMVYGKDTSSDLDLRLERTRQVKQALIDRANLKGVVVPADDGVFDKDILLTTEQANYMLNELGKGGQQGQARSKRSALYFEQEYVKKWDVSRPIQYTFHESLEEWDKNDVRMALAEITRGVPCITFQFVPTVPSGPHLHYMKVDSPSFCGLSYIGKVEGGNPVYLSFACGNAKGVAVHETMHALGVAHQHLRSDRDQWIQVDWSNIDPQHYDTFVVSDAKTFTSYGVPYDYRSIMHYNAYTAALDTNRPTMTPKQNQQQNMISMGQREQMSTRDAEILNKMYCKANCWDYNVYCGAWALKNLCRSQQSGTWMQQNCQKSCNIC